MELEKRRNDEEETKIQVLPTDIITEILLRSPVKSIGRFRSVSKSFSSLYSNPDFAKSHFDLAVRDNSKPWNLLFPSSDQKLFTVNLEDCNRLDHEMIARELEFPGNNYSRSVKIIGYANGLVCVSVDYELFLYNPTIEESRRIPDLPETLYPESLCKLECEDRAVHGFGFDIVSKDYKLLKCFRDNKDQLFIVYVYSLKTDSWKNAGLFNYRLDGYHSGVYAANAIHWIFRIYKDGDNEFLLAGFNLDKEKFLLEMSVPDEPEYDEYGVSPRLGIYKGSLCVADDLTKDEFWVMNKYGTNCTWYKIELDLNDYNNMMPLCSTKNDDEVILVLDNRLVLYNSKTKTRRNLDITGRFLDYSGDMYMATMYFESLISPTHMV